MSQVCKANCGRKLNISYHCASCAGTFHKGCGKLRVYLDESDENVRLCGECQQLPSTLVKYKTIAPGGKRKKRKIVSEFSTSSSDESDDEHPKKTDAVDNPSLSDVLAAINNNNRSNKIAFMNLSSKIDGNTQTLGDYKLAHVQQQQN